jgi:hypothetical protein
MEGPQRPLRCRRLRRPQPRPPQARPVPSPGALQPPRTPTARYRGRLRMRQVAAAAVLHKPRSPPSPVSLQLRRWLRTCLVCSCLHASLL